MFRTDRGEDEGPDEWDHERETDNSDKPKDDDVEIIIRQGGTVEVGYRPAE